MQTEYMNRNEHRQQTVTTNLLQKCYPNVQTLKDYLLGIVNAPILDTANDDDEYREYISNTIVATSRTEKSLKPFNVDPPHFGMAEVVNQAQVQILKQRQKCQNVLTMGYRLLGGKAEGFSVAPSFRNTVVAALRASEWDDLLFRIGVGAMLHLLSETSIFVPLPNGCLCQVTGEPVVFLVPLTKGLLGKTSANPATNIRLLKRPLPLSEAESESGSPPHKRPRLMKPAKFLLPPDVKITKISPADLLFSRARLLYSRPCVIPKTNHVVVGLPVAHILNRLKPAYAKAGVAAGVYEDPSERKQAEHARHVSKYIFPGQYGLSTPFQMYSVKKESFIYPDYLDRDGDIQRKGPCKTPKRLKDVLSLIDKLLWHHGKCGYKALRDLACPSKIPMEDGKKIDSSIILELVSETSIQLETQPSLRLNDTSIDSLGRPIVPFGLTQAKEHAQIKPRFIEFVCSYTEVFRYVALVTKAVIPMSFWGNKANFLHILKAVKRFITCRRYETISLHYVLQGFSTAACDWLAPANEKAIAQGRVSVSDSLKRRELLEEFLFWYFDGFVMPLLKTTFYITESSAFRNQILYFRHDDWKELCAPLSDRLVDGMFERIPDKEAAEILRQRTLGFSFVRLLPKDTGVRPIINLRKKQVVNAGFNFSVTERSINQVLQAAFNVLTYEKNVRIERMGASVFGSDEVHANLKAFKSQLRKDSNGSLPHLYFVKLDVQACFDTIDQPKLLQILKELISEDKYNMHRHTQVHFSSNRIKRTFVKKAYPQGQNVHFMKTATELASVLRNVIFVDQAKYPLANRMEILALLEEHIMENMVKIGPHYYKQKVGIPQGSVLSALLCSFFYGDLEQRHMKFTEDPESVLMRLIDDYLFVTTNLAKAKRFLQMMNKGHPEYGCFISKEKTLTNFEDQTELVNIVDPSSNKFPWCGYLIDMRDLSVSVDYSRYSVWGIENTLTIDRGRRPGASFDHKMLLMGQARNHVIFSDPELNSEYTVYLNIYQNFLLAAMKMNEYIREGGLKVKGNPAFLFKTIQNTIEFSYSSIISQASRKTKNNRNQVSWSPKKLAVLWLGSHAFHHVLSKKPREYAAILRTLDKNLCRFSNRAYKKRFKRLVKEGQSAFNHTNV